MKTSIIIPCYNCEKNIEEIIKSLKKQVLKPTEIICVDDGSTDKTSKIIKKHKSVKYIFQKNSGPAKARNTGAKKAVGEIIFFIDSDCVPEKNWLKEMVKPFKDKMIVGVQGAYKTRQKGIIARFVQAEIEERYERMRKDTNLDWIGSYSAAFRKKEFLFLGGYDESFPIASGEDPEFSFRLVKKTGKKLFFNEKAIVNHKHPETIGKYLKTKYFRAFYRPKMYSEHKEKIVKDSYTPQKIKIEIMLFYITILFVFLGFFFSIFWYFVLLVVLLHIVLETSFLASVRDKRVKAFVIPITFLRTIVFGIGLIKGTINNIVK